MAALIHKSVHLRRRLAGLVHTQTTVGTSRPKESQVVDFYATGPSTPLFFGQVPLFNARGIMDPLSIASSVAGLITLADVVISRTYNTIIKCKNASEDACRLLREVQSLLGILQSVSTL